MQLRDGVTAQNIDVPKDLGTSENVTHRSSWVKALVISASNCTPEVNVGRSGTER